MPELGDLDFSELLGRPENLFLLGEHGGFMLLWSAPKAREIHVFLLPEGRGKWGFDAQAEVIVCARDHGCTVLWARLDPTMRALILFSRRGGMKPTGEKALAFGVEYQIYAMEVPCLLQ